MGVLVLSYASGMGAQLKEELVGVRGFPRHYEAPLVMIIVNSDSAEVGFFSLYKNSTILSVNPAFAIS